VLWGREPEHARGESDQCEHDAPEATPVGEVAERQEEEGSHVPAEDVVVAPPRPRDEIVRARRSDDNPRGEEGQRQNRYRKDHVCTLRRVVSLAATLGVVPTPPGSPLRGYSVISGTSSPPPLREGFAPQIELYGAERSGTPVELPVWATGFSNYTR
jgi:hypothetical protein